MTTNISTPQSASSASSSSFANILSNTFKQSKFTISVKENPSVEDLKEIEKEERFVFRFNNKTKGSYFECHKDEDYYINYYKTFGKPQIYGLYEKNNELKIKNIIGTVSLNYRYDNKVCQILPDLLSVSANA